MPFLPYVPRALSNEASILNSICRQDSLLFLPYDSFQPVVNMIHQASIDPDVLAIKITLYRVDANSAIIEALMEARRNGKAVAAVLELKAKFDETSNIAWARQLEQAGVHVVYGPLDIKVHAKMCLIVRKSTNGIVRICHLSSGNYNTQTARVYGDLRISDVRSGHELRGHRVGPVQCTDRLFSTRIVQKVAGIPEGNKRTE